jgi:hypothetical protein
MSTVKAKKEKADGLNSDKRVRERLKQLDWTKIQGGLHENGYSLVENVFSKEECDSLIASFKSSSDYRKENTLQRYRFGQGEYKYFSYPLPPLINGVREAVYGKIFSVANEWMKELGIDLQYPPTLDELREICRAAGQIYPTVFILEYQEGGYNSLHQDLYGTVYFPMQMAFFLNEVNVDYTGGEFILIEQIPRAQSIPHVFTPNRGDMMLFTTNFRPAKGGRGFYRVNMKRGVSKIKSGERHTLGVVFHDART